MKKQKATFLILILALALTLLAGCKEKPHVHTFDEKWTYDNDSHWHAATCEHKEEKSDSASHDLVSETIREATETQDGLIKVSCSVCGYSKEEPVKYSHTHTFSTDWEKNENYHWHKATCGHDVATTKQRHSFVKGTSTETSCATAGEVTYTCSVCGYVKKLSGRGEHSFGDDDICTVCKGYKCGDDVAAIFDATAETLTVRGTGDMYDYKSSDYTDGKIKWSGLSFDKLIIEDGVTKIGSFAFKNSSAKSVKIGKDVKSIGVYSFLSAKTETLIFVENSTLDRIIERAFEQNSSLKAVEFPSSLRELGPYAFGNCSNLEKITLNEGLISIGDSAFFETSIKEINLPSSYNPDSIKGTSYIAMWRSRTLTTITVAEGNPYVKAIDGILYSLDEKKLIGVPSGKKTVTLADTIEIIGKEAFKGWKGSSVALPESVITIELRAFAYCSLLQSVTMGSKVKSIDETAFDMTPELVEKLTITIAQPEGSILGYETCWRKNSASYTKGIEIKWTGSTSST